MLHFLNLSENNTSSFLRYKHIISKLIFNTAFTFIFFISITAAQIDTSDYYPLQTGNCWQYYAISSDGPKSLFEVVTGDTLMPNGKTYSVVKKTYDNDINWYYYHYFRSEGTAVYEYTTLSCPDGEYKVYDFAEMPDSSLWEICGDDPCAGNARGFRNSGKIFSYVFMDSLDVRGFEYAEINSTDTLWGPCVDGNGPQPMAKGVGRLSEIMFTVGFYQLTGAIINGTKYGGLVGVQENLNQLPNSLNLRIYPNPFNLSTKIKFDIPVSSQIKISVYDLLGREVKILEDKFFTAGSYQTEFDAKDLSTGLYFCRLVLPGYAETKKLILLK